MANKSNIVKGKQPWYHIFNTPIISSIVGSLIVLGLTVLIAYFDIRGDIKYVRANIDSLICQSKHYNSQIKELIENYIIKEDGTELEVGVSSELDQNTVSVFKGNKSGLKFSDAIKLTNTVHMLNPSVKLIVGHERDKKDSDSQADIFISKEAAEQLGVKNYKKTGIFKVLLKKLLKEQNS